MGEVYLAEDTTLRRPVAIKLLPAEFTADRDRLHRFEREAFAASSLNHPNILTIHEIGAEAGHHFIATEFIDGESLRQHLKDERTELHEVLEISVQVASALSAAHAARIVHRDIKPENIMVRKDGIVKVLDFGLAKLAEQGQKGAPDTEAPTRALHHTAPGVVMGTASYMSPEQARGLEVDERTDVWSLGVVLYEMIAGRLPFTGETTTDVLSLILHREPPPLTHLGTHIPAELDRIVTKALKKDKEERYQVVKDLGLDLKSLKQRLEFEAERDRTETPERGSQARGAATASEGGAGTLSTSKIAARPTGQEAGGDIHTTSSAEYIVEGVKRHKRGALAALAALVAVAAAVAYFVYSRYSAGGGDARVRSVAVLPFQNVGGDPEAEYLSDGISEALINNLSRLPQLKIIARSSSFRYKGKEVNVQDAAQALGVQALVTGRVARRGDSLQISVEMVNASEGTQMWGEQYSRKASDVQAVQDEIVRAISERLRLRLTGTQEEQLTRPATGNPQAYEQYLNGLFLLRKGGLDDAKKALTYFNEATTLDPDFALAYALTSYTYGFLAYNGALDPHEAMAQAKTAAQRALKIDETQAEAHVELGFIKAFEWDWARAEAEFKRAIQLNPNLIAAHQRYSQYLPVMGRFDEALAENKRAQELDPLRPSVKGQEAIILFFARRYDEAIRQLQNTLEIDANNFVARGYLGYAYAAQGKYAEAIAEYQKVIPLVGENASIQCYLGYAYAKSGKRAEALAILDKLKRTKEYVSPAELADFYAGLGDREAVFDSLERAYAAHDLQLQYLKVDSNLDPFRSDPRFQDLVRRVGLPQ